MLAYKLAILGLLCVIVILAWLLVDTLDKKD